MPRARARTERAGRLPPTPTPPPALTRPRERAPSCAASRFAKAPETFRPVDCVLPIPAEPHRKFHRKSALFPHAACSAVAKPAPTRRNRRSPPRVRPAGHRALPSSRRIFRRSRQLGAPPAFLRCFHGPTEPCRVRTENIPPKGCHTVTRSDHGIPDQRQRPDHRFRHTGQYQGIGRRAGDRDGQSLPGHRASACQYRPQRHQRAAAELLTTQAATTMGVATLYSLDTAATGVATKDILSTGVRGLGS
ncbi:rebB domain protein [Burkholderia pseudomallei TSV28]|nr:rebB domain protein [Burkholderia pseudomallei TSV28]